MLEAVNVIKMAGLGKAWGSPALLVRVALGRSLEEAGCHSRAQNDSGVWVPAPIFHLLYATDPTEWCSRVPVLFLLSLACGLICFISAYESGEVSYTMKDTPILQANLSGYTHKNALTVMPYCVVVEEML